MVSPVSDIDCCSVEQNGHSNHFQAALTAPHDYLSHGLDFSVTQQDGWFGGDTLENAWSMEDLWFLEQSLCSDI